MNQSTAQLRPLPASENGRQTASQSVLPLPSTSYERLVERAKALVSKAQEQGVLAKWAAPVLLSALLFYGFSIWQNNSTQMKELQLKFDQQHDLLTRLDQQLQDKNTRDVERKEELEKRLQNIDAVQIVLGRDLAKLQAKLNPNAKE